MPSVLTIGIAGGTCSGKSTLASALSVHLGQSNCILVPMDDFYKQQPDEVLASGAANFDLPEAFDLESFANAVESLRDGREVRIPDYDRKTSHIVGSRVLKPRPVLIVEGMFVLLDRRVRQCFDVAIFLEVDPAVQLSRRLKRDVDEYGVHPDRVHHAYERNIEPAYRELIAPTRATADLVLSGQSANDEHLLNVVAHLQAHKVYQLYRNRGRFDD